MREATKSEGTPMSIFRRFHEGDEAATAVEYAVMLAMIIIVALTGIQSLGMSVFNSFTTTNAQFQAAGIGGP
jgi:Flp pilus assembly pilin Flp